jgi:hypothetical protein
MCECRDSSRAHQPRRCQIRGFGLRKASGSKRLKSSGCRVADALAYRRADEVRLVPIVTASGAKVD